MKRPRSLTILLGLCLIGALLLGGCGPREVVVVTPELSAEKAVAEFALARDYYGAYLERYYEFPELAGMITDEELALVGFSYGQCMAELAGELVESDGGAAARSRAANYYEIAGNAFRIAAGTRLPAYKQPSLYSTVLVYNTAVELDGEARPDLIETTLEACDDYFSTRSDLPELFRHPDDDAVVALVKTQLLYRRGRDAEAREFFEGYLEEYGALKGGDWPVLLVGRLGDQTFHAGLYDHAEELYRRAAEMGSANAELLQRYEYNTQVADFFQGLTLESRVPPRRYDLLEPRDQALLDEALAHYDDVAGRSASEEIAGRALFRRGYLEELWLLDHAAARRTYTAVFETYPDHPLAPTACFRAGICAEERGDFDGARRLYARLGADYPRSVEAPLVELREGILLLEESGYAGSVARRGARRVQGFIDGYSGQEAYRLWVGEAYAALGRRAEVEGDAAGALELYTRAVEEHGFREGIRYGSERIARAYLLYAEHHLEEFDDLVIGHSLAEVERGVVRLSELRNKIIFGYGGADSYGDLETSAHAKFMAGTVLESFATRLQDIEITSGAPPDELLEIYYQINYPTRSFFLQAQRAYEAAVATARLAGPDSPTLERAEAAYQRLSRIIGEP